MVDHAIISIKGIKEKIYSKEKQKQKPIHYITNIDHNLLASLNVNIENINSNEKIYSKENKSNRLYFFKKLEKKLKKRSKADYFNVRRKNSKTQSKLIMWARKKNLKYKFKRKRKTNPINYISSKN